MSDSTVPPIQPASLGFQLKGSSKRKKLDSLPDTVDHGDKKIAILGIEKGVLEAVDEEHAEPTAHLLVIPLPPTRSEILSKQNEAIVSGESVVVDLVPKSIDEIATEELLQESLLNGEVFTKNDRNLSIPLNGSSDILKTQKSTPLLMQNLAPELISIKDEDQRFKADVLMRPDDMNVRSDAYISVPVEDFGAAMLRGMGWSDPTANEKSADSGTKGLVGFENQVPRENRLGLGAMARPPDAKDKRRGTKEQRDQKNKDWDKKVEKSLKKQQLNEQDFVWLRDPLYAGRRARIVAVRGVPGLDRIRVILETNGMHVEVKRSDAVLLSIEELNDRPYVQVAPAVDAPKLDTSTKFFGLVNNNKDIPSSQSHNNSMKSSGNKRDREGNESTISVDKKQQKLNKESHPSSSSGVVSDWLMNGIRVRIVSKKVEASSSSTCYLCRGCIIDVPGKSIATVQLEDGRVLESVKERYLETILPTIGGACIVLVGPRRGQLATLLEKKKEEGLAIVQLTEDLDIECLSMDYIASLGQNNHQQ